MKLIFSLLLFAGLSQAQVYSDGYHSEPMPSCDAEACLISGDIEMGLNAYYDDHGFFHQRLNTSSALSDVLHEGNQVCFRGGADKVVKIIEGLAGNDERNYYDGGHQLIENLVLYPSSDSISYDISVFSDYGPYKLSGVVPKCAL